MRVIFFNNAHAAKTESLLYARQKIPLRTVLIYIPKVHFGRDRNAHGRITRPGAAGAAEADDKAFLRWPMCFNCKIDLGSTKTNKYPTDRRS